MSDDEMRLAAMSEARMDRRVGDDNGNAGTIKGGSIETGEWFVHFDDGRREWRAGPDLIAI